MFTELHEASMKAYNIKHVHLCKKMSCLSEAEASLSTKGYHYVWVGRLFKHVFIHSTDICRVPTWNLAFYKV